MLNTISLFCCSFSLTRSGEGVGHFLEEEFTVRDNICINREKHGHMSQENQEITKHSDAQDNAERQRQHVKRKQETHSRLQCWISNRHAERLHELGQHLEDSQASLIEQAIDLLYRHELVPARLPETESAELIDEQA